MKVKDQLITDDYALYCGDSTEVLQGIPDKSIDLSIYSPPFSSLYTYSSDHRDLSNAASNEEFLNHYDYIVKEMARVTKPGRINAIHITDIHDSNCKLWDLPHEVIKIHEKYGMHYRNRITVWKEPLKVRIQTMLKSLMHKTLIEDSTRVFPAMPDYILIFTKAGENEVPVTHPYGLFDYAGETPILPNILKAYNNANKTNYTADQIWEHLNIKYAQWDDPSTNKLSHVIWQRYASSVWDDIRVSNVIPYRDSREDEDEKHVTPTQLDVIDRLVELYSNPGETVLTPFMGVGSEVYSSVSMGRKSIGIELKDSYYRQSVKNMKVVNSRFTNKQKRLF